MTEEEIRNKRIELDKRREELLKQREEQEKLSKFFTAWGLVLYLVIALIYSYFFP